MNNLVHIFRDLYKNFGPQGWWPLSGLNLPLKKYDSDFINYKKSNLNGTISDFKKNWPRHIGIEPKTNNQRFEIIIGAILTQNTNWRNVEKAIYNLNKKNSLSIKKIKKINKTKLANIIKSSGYYNQKADRLKSISNFFSKNKIFNLSKLSIKNLRKKLLKIKGIGPETADSILLYAFQKPIFVIDAYTKRIMARLGYKEKGYDELQKLFIKNLPNNANLFKEYHALLVELGKNYCKKIPRCVECPINNFCIKN